MTGTFYVVLAYAAAAVLLIGYAAKLWRASRHGPGPGNGEQP